MTMENPDGIFWILLTACLYMHVLDDFVLQKATLCDLKQKAWWQKLIGHEFDRTRYRHDYIAALMVHAAHCSAGMLLPIILYTLYKGLEPDVPFIAGSMLVNTLVHAFVDNLKANELAINLVEDQAVHVVQIVATLVVFVMRNLA